MPDTTFTLHTLKTLLANHLSTLPHLLILSLYPNISQCGTLKMPLSQTRPPQPKKTITTQVLLNKDWNKGQQSLSKESPPCRVKKPAPKENPTIPPKPRFSSKQLSLSLQHLRRDFTALQTTWNENLRSNAITNCFGRIHDSITKLESIALAISGYETTAPSAPTSLSREELDRFLMSTTHRAKHWSFCVWYECDVHMDGKDRHYYPSGPRAIPVSRPLYSTSCFVAPHHPKRRYEDRWAIPPPFTDDNGYPVFHTIINRDNEHSSNHAAQEDLLVPDAPVDYDDPFPDEPSRALDVRAFQLSQHLKGKWYNSLRKATASDPLFDIVSKNANHPS